MLTQLPVFKNYEKAKNITLAMDEALEESPSDVLGE
jgi:hypothetical protein